MGNTNELAFPFQSLWGGLYSKCSECWTHFRSPQNKLGAWSCWTSRHVPGSDRRRGWAHVWPLDSCETAGGCCSDTERSGNTRKYHHHHKQVRFSQSSTICNIFLIFITWEEAASKPPLTVPSQSSQEKCLSLNTLLRREEKDVIALLFCNNNYSFKYGKCAQV